MTQRTSQSNIVMETDDAASDDSSDVDIYVDEPTEVPPPPTPPPQQIASPSKRSKAPTRGTEWNDADHDRQYDLTPLGEKSTNRRTHRSAPSYSIDPYEVTRAKEIARAEKEREAAADPEGYVDRRLPRFWL
jgi:hypothetical protein